ncbi:MAG: DUF4389 domain-containing protein [Actinomycetota bacterium]|nr:DUF4389 domain-containing protein [Actinomycetota bacterium]
MSDHPIRLLVTDDLRRSRLTVFFRLLLAIPHFIFVVLWSVVAFFAAIAGWFAALVTGRLPNNLHGFLAAYVRYVTHLGAYLALAANPYPGFTGDPGYPVDIEIPHGERQPRWKIAIRLLLAIPALLLAATLGSGFGGGSYTGGQSDGAANAQWFTSSGVGGVAALCAFFGWFAAMALGRMPGGLRNLGAYGLGYTAQAYAYVLLLTERYPNADPEALGPEWELPAHPIELDLTDDGRRSRLTVFFRLLLAFPHFFWLALWSIAAILASSANWLVALIRGRSAGPLHRFLAAYTRYYTQVTAFVFLVANPFPGFTGRAGYPAGVTIGPPEPQKRLVTFFRFFLSLPAFFLSGALSFVLVVVGILGWFAALATGRMPRGLRNLGATSVRYLAQTNAYWLVVTDAYPHASPALRPPAEPEPKPEPFVAPEETVH